MPRSTLRTATVAAALAVLLGSCASESEEPRRLDLADDASSTTPHDASSTSPDDTATDDPAADDPAGGDGDDAGRPPLATSYPEVGLEFEALPEAAGARRGALETYVAYERGLRQLSRTAEPNALITDHAGQPMIDTMESTLDYLRGNDVRYRGTAVVSVAFDGASSRAAVLDLCTDASDLELVTDGNAGPVEGRQRVAGRVVLTNNGGTWSVTQYDTLEETC